MTTYLVAQLNIHDRERYAEYGAGFMNILTKYHGKVLGVDEDTQTLEGDWDFTRTVLLAFPSEAEAKSWYHSQEYQQLAQHRFAASAGNVVMMKGLE
jgi:uncharacterized protein (DUF1330 family)